MTLRPLLASLAAAVVLSAVMVSPAQADPTVGPVPPNPNQVQPQEPSGSAAPTPPAASQPSGGAAAPGTGALPSTNGAKTRAQSFLTGVLPAGTFDPEGYNLWYVPATPSSPVPDWLVGIGTVVSPLLGGAGAATNAVAAHVPNANDLAFGGGADACFTVYKWLIWGSTSLVGFLVFSLPLTVSLFAPALDIAESFRATLLTPGNLAGAALALTIFWGVMLWLRRHYGRALIEYATSALLFVTIAVTLPVKAITWVLNALTSASATILIAGSGKDVSSVPEPSTTKLDTTTLMVAYHAFTSSVQEALIRPAAQVLTFGVELPKECQAAYDQGAAQHLATTDPNNFKPLAAIAQCKPFLAAAQTPEVSRLVFAIFLFAYGIAFGLVFAYLAWPALKGQVLLMAAVALSPLLLLWTMLPGKARYGAIRMWSKVFLSAVGIVIFSVQISVMVLLMNAVLTAASSTTTAVRLILALVIPGGLIVGNGVMRHTIERQRAELTRSITHEKERPNPYLQGISNRADKLAGSVKAAGWTAAQAGAAYVSGGTTAVAAAAKAGAVKAGGRVLKGDGERAGLLLGPMPKKAPVGTETAEVVGAASEVSSSDGRPATAPRLDSAPRLFSVDSDGNAEQDLGWSGSASSEAETQAVPVGGSTEAVASPVAPVVSGVSGSSASSTRKVAPVPVPKAHTEPVRPAAVPLSPKAFGQARGAYAQLRADLPRVQTGVAAQAATALYRRGAEAARAAIAKDALAAQQAAAQHQRVVEAMNPNSADSSHVVRQAVPSGFITSRVTENRE